MTINNTILIVGAGSTGLTMAAELTRHGIPCRIIDKNNQLLQVKSNQYLTTTNTHLSNFLQNQEKE
jgi:2-polyprenyl-6-methoxyphenol hydroxylase-like FAD-dependent oxidoreductase